MTVGKTLSVFARQCVAVTGGQYGRYGRVAVIVDVVKNRLFYDCAQIRRPAKAGGKQAGFPFHGGVGIGKVGDVNDGDTGNFHPRISHCGG